MNRVFALVTFATLATLLCAAAMPRPAGAEVDKKTLRTWKAKCASCHGDDGKGATDQGKKMGVRDMTTAEFAKEATDAKMTDGIANGVKQTKDGKVQQMEAYKDKLKPEEIAALVAYVKSFRK